VLVYSFKLNASTLKVKRDKPKPLLHEACQNNHFHVNCVVCVKALVLDIRKQWSARREKVRNSEYVAPPMTEKLVYCAKAPPPTHVPGCQCPLCNIREGKQCHLLSYFSASQQPLGHQQLRPACSKRAISIATSTHAHTRGVRARRHPHLPHPKASQTPA